eukprot:CAMPEP_0182548528 /NCGR_PEP_ID=MMETSP1323-20130603/38940_1 /TAXON_ID=236787 /ORGANISM="Florenciella parvula, Strain RCC1693" /LENGTH=74 /DNA_ID=CAMNT_0024759925 /DNA_START=26 /DNA_END=249 /DNA_ORIENTATION=-
MKRACDKRGSEQRESERKRKSVAAGHTAGRGPQALSGHGAQATRDVACAAAAPRPPEPAELRGKLAQLCPPGPE